MLHLYSASDFGLLVNRYQKISATIEHSILEPQPLIVPNMKIAKWLSLQVASVQGIDANSERILPAEYSWRLAKQLNPQLSKHSDFSCELLVLRIYAVFEEQAFCANFPRLTQYLQQSEPVDWMKLAARTAKLFESYQLFRFDWLEAWEKGDCLGLGDDESWQQALWQRLVESSKQPPRYKLHQQLIAALKNSPEKLVLPKALCFFGVSYIPPTIVELIEALSTQIEVFVFAFSPATSKRNSAEQSLQNWQAIWQDLSDRFPAESQKMIDAPLTPNSNLKVLKAAVNGLQVDAITKTDNSIAIVSCYSPMREVEALHDYLLNRFKNDKSLSPSDVLVVIPELEKYAPFIRSVFEHGAKKLPYQFADSQGSRQSALLMGLQSLLEVSRWRFDREQVETLLSNRLIQKKFEFSDADLEQINLWLDQAAIHWGIDGQHKAELGLPADEQNTWRSGLDRLLLGFALPCAVATDLPLFGEDNILPADEVDSASAEKLSRFIDYCESLFVWHKTAKQAKTISQWQLSLQTLLDDLFYIDAAEQGIYQQLLQAIDKMTLSAEQSRLVSNCDIHTMAALLDDFLPEPSSGGRLTGCINFAGMSSLAGLPFKTICLLGMNYESWPSRHREPGFDLIQSHLVAGDRQRSQLERYQTLQFLLAAQHSLYISYTGYNINSGEQKPPSVLVSELQDLTVQLGISLTTLHHPMHVFSSANYQTGLLQSHSQQWQGVAMQVGQGSTNLPDFCAVNSSSIEAGNLSIDELLLFFRSPQKAYLKHALGLYLYDESEEWINAEPFELANFTDSAVRSGVLDLVLKNDSDAITDALKMAKASGILPHGMHGEIVHQKQADKLTPQLEGIAQHCQTALRPAEPIEITLDIPVIDKPDDLALLAETDPKQTNSSKLTKKRLTLTGLFDGLRAEGYHLVLADKLYDHKKVEVWLKHLILCCAKPKGAQLVTRVICADGVIEFAAVDRPEQVLALWISAMLKGLAEPISYFHRCSFKYAEVIATQPDNVEKALNLATAAWEDGFIYQGESSKPVNQYIYRDTTPIENEDFQAWTKLLLLPLLRCLEESKTVKKSKGKN